MDPEPKYEVGQAVLVDQAGAGVVREVERGMVPAVNDDLTIGEEPGFWYVVDLDAGGRSRAPDYDVTTRAELDAALGV